MIWVGRDLKDHVIPAPCPGQEHVPLARLLIAPPSLAVNTSRDGAAITSLGCLFQCPITLSVKNVFLIPQISIAMV